MDASSATPGLSELRRELEEILALVNSDAQTRTRTAYVSLDPIEVDSPPAIENDELFDDALVVVTEFGQATAAILQMWLSIDYARATRILTRFEAQGLVSAKGRVRHKAYEMRRTGSIA